MWVCACGWPNPAWRDACECCSRSRDPGGLPPGVLATHETPLPGVDLLSGGVLNDEARKAIEAEELHQLFQAIQQREGSDGAIPASSRTILQRLRYPFAYTGGILLGTLLGVVTLLFNFLLFNFILHMEF